MPGPSRRIVPIPFNTGLSEKQDVRYLAEGSMAQIRNGVKDKAGRIAKRKGLQNLNTSPLGPITGYRSSSHKGNLTYVGDDGFQRAIWQYDESAQVPLICDYVPEVAALPRRQVMAFEQNITEMDTLVSGGFEMHVWLAAPVAGSTPDVFFTVLDAATYAVVIPSASVPSLPSTATTVAEPKLILCGTTAVMCVYMIISGVGAVQVTTFGMASPLASTWSSSVAVGSTAGLTANGIYDVSAVAGDATQFVLVSQNSATDLSCLRIQVSPVAVQVSGVWTDALWNTDANPPISGFGCTAHSADGVVYIAYAWNTGGGLQKVRADMQQYPTTSTQFATPVSLFVGGISTTAKILCLDVLRLGTIGGTSNNALAVFSSNMTNPPTATPNQYTAAAVFYASVGACAVQANQPSFTWNMILASRIYVGPNQTPYFVGYFNSTVQGTFYLMALDWLQSGSFDFTVRYGPARWVATFGQRLAKSQMFATAHTLPHFYPNPDVATRGVAQTLLPISQTAARNAPTVAAFDFVPVQGYEATELGECLHLAAGAPFQFDGQRSFEIGFPYAPEWTLNSGSTGPGGSVGDGTYSYIAIFETTDARGQVHRSARSPPLSIAVAGGPVQVTLVPLACSWSMRQRFPSITKNSARFAFQAPIYVKIYRTQNGGTTYFLVSGSGQGLEIPVASQANTIFNPSLTFIDTLADASISGNELLYGDGGNGQNGSNLDIFCPPSFQHLIFHKDRLWGVDGSDIWYTKALTTGEGTGFTEDFAFTVDDAGFVTALASLDDKLVIFKRGAIYYVTGDGPSDSGANNDLSPPQKVQTDVGCRDWRSVVSTPKGIWFDSDVGRYLLTRDLQVVAAGKPVEDELATYPVTTSAVLHPSSGRVLWTMNTDDTLATRNGEGVTYDYILDAWSTWSPLRSSGGTDSVVGPISACVANAIGTLGSATILTPTYHTLDQFGQVRRESTSFYFDSSISYVPMTASSPWVKASGIEGWERFRRLLITWLNNDPHDLLVSVLYDYATTPNVLDQTTITAAQMAAFTTPLAQFAIMLRVQRAQAVQVTIQDVLDGAVTGQGPILISAALEVTVHDEPRLAQIPVTQRG